jgi:hypothetical protein
MSELVQHQHQPQPHQHQPQPHQQPPQLFEHLVVYILAYADVDAAQTAALVHKLQLSGASLTTRLSHKITHVVVQRTHAPSPADQAEGEGRLREVFAKLFDHVQQVSVVCGETAQAAAASAASATSTAALRGRRGQQSSRRLLRPSLTRCLLSLPAADPRQGGARGECCVGAQEPGAGVQGTGGGGG